MKIPAHRQRKSKNYIALNPNNPKLGQGDGDVSKSSASLNDCLDDGKKCANIKESVQTFKECESSFHDEPNQNDREQQCSDKSNEKQTLFVKNRTKLRDHILQDTYSIFEREGESEKENAVLETTSFTEQHTTCRSTEESSGGDGIYKNINQLTKSPKSLSLDYDAGDIPHQRGNGMQDPLEANTLGTRSIPPKRETETFAEVNPQHSLIDFNYKTCVNEHNCPPVLDKVALDKGDGEYGRSESRDMLNTRPPYGYFIRKNESDLASVKKGVVVPSDDTGMAIKITIHGARVSVSSHSESCNNQNYKMVSNETQTPLRKDKQENEENSVKEVQWSKNRRVNNDLDKKRYYVLRTGLVMKSNSCSEKIQPLHYKKKKLCLKTSSLVKSSTLPVSRDSIFYYYEPQGESDLNKNKRNKKNINTLMTKNFNQNACLYKTCPKTASFTNELSPLDFHTSSGPFFSSLSETAHFNINVNSNASDTEVDGGKEVKVKENHTPTSCSSAISGDTFFSTKTDEDATENISVSDLTGRTSKFDSLQFMTAHIQLKENNSMKETKKFCRTHPSSGNEIEGTVDEHTLDSVVEEFIQKVVKGEAGSEQGILHGNPDGSKSKSVPHKRKPVNKLDSFNVKCGIPNIKKVPAKDEERLRSFVTKSSGKVSSPRNELIYKSNDLKIGSYSSPSIPSFSKSQYPNSRQVDMYAEATEKSQLVNCHRVESLPEALDASFLQVAKVDSSKRLVKQASSDRLCKFAECFQVDTTLKKNEHRPSTNTQEVSKDPHISDVEDNNDDEEDCLSQKDKYHLKKKDPDHAHRPILRQGSPRNKERMHSLTNKRPRKRKSASTLKKCNSLSPVTSVKKRHRDSSGKRQSPRRTDSKESRDHSSKKNQSLKSGKKNMKKVRIMVDGNESPAKNCKHQESYMNSKNKEASDEEEEERYANNLQDNPSLSDINASPTVFHVGPHVADDYYEDEDNEDGDNPDNEKEEECSVSTILKHSNTDQSPISPALTQSTKSKTGRKVKSKTSTKSKKVPKGKEETITKAEQGWDNRCSTVTKTDSKMKTGEVKKRKRYQLKKANEKQIQESRSPKPDKEDCGQGEASSHREDEETEKQIGHSTDPEYFSKRSSGYGANCKTHKPIPVKKPSYSPKRKKGAEEWQVNSILVKTSVAKDPGEGSSVDAPGFGKKDFALRGTRSGPAVCGAKQSTRDVLDNALGQRVRTTRDNFARLNKKNNHLSPPVRSPQRERFGKNSDQVDPKESRSTDLDVALGFKRQHSSPFRLGGSARIARRESKIGGGKPRSKSEPDSASAKLTYRCMNKSPPKMTHFTDPMDMNVLNLGLSWVVQGLINRIPYFSQQSESKANDPRARESPARPEVPTTTSRVAKQN